MIRFAKQDMKKSTTHECVYRLKVSLDDVNPPVWRRIRVPGQISLRTLSYALQIVMGWESSHRYRFVIGGTVYSIPDADDLHPTKDPNKIEMYRVLRETGEAFEYRHEVHDDWKHDVAVDAIEPPDPALNAPDCLEGSGACPPSECGSPGEYRDFLDTLIKGEGRDRLCRAFRKHQNFDPEAFDREEINGRLTCIRLK
ncbi:plasmid pRiA4b ORF-3 family protein [Acidobacteriota bacterium]